VLLVLYYVNAPLFIWRVFLSGRRVTSRVSTLIELWDVPLASSCTSIDGNTFISDVIVAKV
jgi:hypothetical protein